ncbi:hypothetical protein CLOM_g5801 [Closterium sp. NIES-68]|nr:hypothetical protein CLOM_g5800 [Closterium sp. NIES-68]GJP46524.1 hypothetical protein CLOM_g5801 [Closterium sp. NIES-68]GJP73856.1 hypothetical protein CLOP_g4532 [Closterium sp. NIES-67]
MTPDSVSTSASAVSAKKQERSPFWCRHPPQRRIPCLFCNSCLSGWVTSHHTSMQARTIRVHHTKHTE